MLDRVYYCVHCICVLVILLHVSLHIHSRALSLELHHLTTALFESEYRRVPNNASALVTYSVLLPGISSRDQLVLGTIAMLAGNVTTEILKGAHVVLVNDAGCFYAWVVAMNESYRRACSHKSMRAAYSVSGLFYQTSILTGITMEDEDSWFQLEADLWNWGENPRQSMMHALNYAYYKIADVQVGVYGTSIHTDQRPLCLIYDRLHTTRQDETRGLAGHKGCG